MSILMTSGREAFPLQTLFIGQFLKWIVYGGNLTKCIENQQSNLLIKKSSNKKKFINKVLKTKCKNYNSTKNKFLDSCSN